MAVGASIEASGGRSPPALRDLALERLDFGSRAPQLQHAPVREQEHAISTDEIASDTRKAVTGRGPREMCSAFFTRKSVPTRVTAGPSSSSSMARRRLYFARRSPRHAEPVLMRPALTATARSAIVSSRLHPIGARKSR